LNSIDIYQDFFPLNIIVQRGFTGAILHQKLRAKNKIKTKYMTSNEAMNWRYATKRMKGKAIPDKRINRIIEAIHLSPSAMGLQPYEVLVISNNEIKSKIQPIAFNQKQVAECSHLLVFAAWNKYSESRIDKVFDHLAQQRNLPFSETEGQRNSAKKYFGEISDDENFHHAAKQAGIALGIAVLTAALEGIDASPMEGFNPIALDEFLGLTAKGLRSTMLLALGYRDEVNDWNHKLKKVRKPNSELVTMIK
jgi:nitroreductase / dihydropteridine reductase